MPRTSSTQGSDEEVRKEEYPHSDHYIGTAEALIKAGIVEEHMLPGQPGRNKTSVTFNGDKPSDYLQIQRRSAKRFEVRKGVSEEETERRKEKRAEEQKRERSQAAALVGVLAVRNPEALEAMVAATISDARFQVGDVCTHDGMHMEIIGKFDFYKVWDTDTHYAYRWGYLARQLGEKEHFWAAHKLCDLDGGIRHLRLVGAASANTGDDLKPAA